MIVQKCKINSVGLSVRDQVKNIDKIVFMANEYGTVISLSSLIQTHLNISTTKI